VRHLFTCSGVIYIEYIHVSLISHLDQGYHRYVFSVTQCNFDLLSNIMVWSFANKYVCFSLAFPAILLIYDGMMLITVCQNDNRDILSSTVLVLSLNLDLCWR
jgi:hypothetical protein